MRWWIKKYLCRKFKLVDYSMYLAERELVTKYLTELNMQKTQCARLWDLYLKAEKRREDVMKELRMCALERAKLICEKNGVV